MLILLSPAKSLDYSSKVPSNKSSEPKLLPECKKLIKILKSLQAKDIKKLMNLSDNLAKLNYERYQAFHTPFKTPAARQAIFAFSGDVYAGFDAYTLTGSDITFANKHIRILSGLYGVLKPLDLILPYRLEMGTKFKTEYGDNLYDFWGETITKELNTSKADFIINLASNEYFKAVKPKLLQSTIVTPVFKDYKNGEYKVISFLAKKARGLMTRYIVDNKITDVLGLESFNYSGYKFNKKLSDDKQLIFLRK